MIALWIFLGVAMLFLNLGCIWIIVEMIKDRTIMGAISVGILEALWFLLTYLYLKNVFLSYGVML